MIFDFAQLYSYFSFHLFFCEKSCFVRGNFIATRPLIIRRYNYYCYILCVFFSFFFLLCAVIYTSLVTTTTKLQGNEAPLVRGFFLISYSLEYHYIYFFFYLKLLAISLTSDYCYYYLFPTGAYIYVEI